MLNPDSRKPQEEGMSGRAKERNVCRAYVPQPSAAQVAIMNKACVSNGSK